MIVVDIIYTIHIYIYICIHKYTQLIYLFQRVIFQFAKCKPLPSTEPWMPMAAVVVEAFSQSPGNSAHGVSLGEGRELALFVGGKITKTLENPRKTMGKW